MNESAVSRYCASPALMSAGNALTLLQDGAQAYPSMLEAIEKASSCVCLETYILRSDRTGERFASALAAAAKRGVSCRVLFDSIGSWNVSPDFLHRLEHAGVKVHEYRPPRSRPLPWDMHRRDHRKILTVDGKAAFVGGINIGDEYAPVEEGGEGWRDNHIRVEGPAAWELEASFLSLWRRETREKVRPSPRPPPGPSPARVRTVTNENWIMRHRIRRAYLHALRRAERSIEIANAYFIPDRFIRRALKKAAARGVSVRLLAPSRSDAASVLHASRRLYEELLSAGIRIFRYNGAVLHSKTVVVDRAWCAVGSYNMDHRSLFHNLEVNLSIVDPEFAEALGRSFESDIENSTEISPAQWRRRPLTARLKEFFFYSLRYWL